MSRRAGWLLLVVWLAGCVEAGGAPQEVERVVSGEPVAQFDVDGDGCAVAAISQEEAALHQKRALHAAEGPPLVVFLNGQGGTYTRGSNDSARNISSIARSGSRVPAFERGQARWDALVSCVQDQFAAFNIAVTDIEPTGGNYIEAVVGGSPGDIGVGNGIAGIAPIDKWNCRPMEKAVAFVFSRNIGSDQRLCEVTAHEIGHTLSLEHEYLCEDPMTYLSGCGVKSFQDREADCGTYRRERCECRGGKQNTVAAMLDLIGPSNGEPPPSLEDDAGPPQVEVVTPADGARLPQSSVIEVQARASDDQRLARVELVWDYNGKTYACPTQEQYVTCTREGDLHTWRVEVGTGSRTFQVRAVDVVGREATTVARTVTLVDPNAPEPNDPEPNDPEPGDPQQGPSVVIVGPVDGERAMPQSTVEVVAEVSAGAGVDKAQLIWDFNGQTYECPSQSQHVDCQRQGDRFHWVVTVGTEGARPFRVRAFDRAGRQITTDTRTVQVEAIPDQGAPVVEVLEPAQNATLPASSTVPVVARVEDDGAVRGATLVWDFNGQTYACPLRSQYVDCDVEGTTYRWSVRVGQGTRSFRVQATDAVGNQGVSEDRRFSLSR